MFKMFSKYTNIFIIVLISFTLYSCKGEKEFTTKTFFTSDAFFSVTLPRNQEHIAEEAFKKAEEYSSSGKGYAADMAGKFLKEKGVENFAVNFGSNVYSIGKKNNGSFSVGIPNPLDPNRIISAVKLKNCGVSTYPDSGKLGDGNYASLSVSTDNAEKAQLLAKSYYILSEDDINTVCRENNTPVLIVQKNGDVEKFCGWEKIELK